jgi:hypothetical protein
VFKRRFSLAVVLSCLAVWSPARADEGMWTFDAFPAAKVAAAYGFTPTPAFLDHIRESSLRIAGGCSASFVSARGLVMTNHHCTLGCVSQLSTPAHNYVERGFYAKTEPEETKCPGFELDRLDTIEDVTQDVQSATAGKTGRALVDALQAKEGALSLGCGTSEAIRCDVVSLYHGGIYKLYHYKRYTDVRLAFTPEYAVAQFGGDPDNFNFPRFDYDCSFVRAYEDGKPAATPEYLHWSKNGSKAGDLVFVSGNPGATQRLLTVSELEYLRDVSFPRVLPNISELRGILERYQTESPEQLRQTKDLLFGLENSYKALFGREGALLDPAFFAKKVAEERELRAAIALRPELAKTVGPAWDELAAIEQKKKTLYYVTTYVAGGPNSTIFRFARTLVRLPVEKAKPDAQRLPEFGDAKLVTLPQSLLARVPIYAGTEEIELAYWAKKMREDLGTDDPFVKLVLGAKTPDVWAHDVVAGSTLGDAGVRKALYDGGGPAIAASTDTMIAFARTIDAASRAARKRYEDEVTGPEGQLDEAIAKARFAVFGTTVDPDATFTARLSYGAVAGFVDGNGKTVPPYTTVAGLFARATGSEPYALPPTWLAAQSVLPPSTPMNLSSTNDIIGGNSGSPLVDKNGDVVGLIFDGDIFSLGGAFGYEPAQNRSVSVDSRAILAGLRAVYHADRLASEIAP